MQKEENSKSVVIRKIERIVCDCVNNAFLVLAIDKYTPVLPSTLYGGVTNIALAKRMARSAVFAVAHDRFGMSYKEIEFHSRICVRNIMRSVKVYKDSPNTDNIVNKVNELIEVELNKFPII